MVVDGSPEFSKRYFDLVEEQIIHLDPDFRIIESNRAANDFFRKKGISDFQGLTCQELCIFRDVDGNHVCPAIESKKTKQKQSEELLTNDGETWLVKVYPIFSKKKELEGFVEVSINITDQKKIHDSLKENDEILDSIIQNSPRGFVAFKGKNNLVITNPALEEMLGYTHEELKEKTLLGATHAEDVEMSMDVSNKALEEQTAAIFEKRYITKDGRILPARVVTWGTFDEEGNWKYNFGSIEDITKLKEDERAIKESEHKFRNIVETSRDWIWEADLDGIHTYSNPRVFDFLGYKPDEILGKSIYEYMTEVEAKQVKSFYSEYVKKKEPFYDVDMTCLHKSGKTVYLKTSAVPIVNETGNLTGYRGVDRDITEKKLAEDKLIESEKRYRELVETMNEGLVIVNENNIIEYSNNALCNILGYKEDELVGNSIFDFMPEAEMSVVLNQIEKRKSGEEEQKYELSLTKKDDSHVHARISPRRMYDRKGDFVGSLSVVADITELKQTMLSLTVSEEKFRTIFEHSIDAYWLRDLAGTLLAINPRFEELTGYDKNEVLGSAVSNYLTIDGLQSELTSELLKSGIIRREIDVKLKDGSIKPLEISLIKFDLGDEEVIFGIGKDITERKEAEQLRRDAYEHIEQNIVNFETLVDKIRNPLAVIIGSAELNDLALNDLIIENADNISEITKLMTRSWIESIKFRQILQEQLFHES